MEFENCSQKDRKNITQYRVSQKRLKKKKRQGRAGGRMKKVPSEGIESAPLFLLQGFRIHRGTEAVQGGQGPGCESQAMSC